MLRKSIAILLEDEDLSDHGPTKMPGTFDVLFRACQSLVTLRGEYGGSEEYGEKLYSALRIGLERCVSRVANQLTAKQARDDEETMDWVRELNEKCDWFVKRIVRFSSTTSTGGLN
jgi:hypothetical protein